VIGENVQLCAFIGYLKKKEKIVTFYTFI